MIEVGQAGRSNSVFRHFFARHPFPDIFVVDTDLPVWINFPWPSVGTKVWVRLKAPLNSIATIPNNLVATWILSAPRGYVILDLNSYYVPGFARCNFNARDSVAGKLAVGSTTRPPRYAGSNSRTY
jgi:hypothetical protein